MKVGDYLKHGNCVFYLTEDLTKDDTSFFEFKVLVVYTTIPQPNKYYYVGSTKMKLIIPKNDPIEPVTPIFVKDEK